MVASRAPLLVTGLPRSGTSWVGKMLQASGEVVYVNEPMNPHHPPGHSPGVLRARVTRRFQYLDGTDDEGWAAAFGDTVRLRYHLVAELRQNRGLYDLARAAKYCTSFTAGRILRRRALLDDPYAILSVPWFVSVLGCRVVVLVRDPVAFVASWRALGWSIHFHELLEQPRLVKDHLGRYVDQMRSLIGSPDDLARTALLWRMVYDVVDSSFRDLAGVHIVGYESLVRDPITGFADLYDVLCLRWGERAETEVRRATVGGAGGAHRWSWRGGLSRTAYRPLDPATALSSYRDRLSSAEIARVRELTDDVAARFGPRVENGP